MMPAKAKDLCVGNEKWNTYKDDVDATRPDQESNSGPLIPSLINKSALHELFVITEQDYSWTNLGLWNPTLRTTFASNIGIVHRFQSMIHRILLRFPWYLRNKVKIRFWH